jgi:hypothetical protein
MFDYLRSNWFGVLIILVLLSWVVYLVVTKQWDYLRHKAYELIIYAEGAIKGSKKGQERFDYVIKVLYQRVPKWMQFFITEQSLKEKLQEWFDILKDWADNGKVDGSVEKKIV